ncbi:MAG TPA: hypothetical protein VNQ76_01170 [Planctomicrobium sp.]|nr:hypothetical protein [Planctomicrobium sp.]
MALILQRCTTSDQVLAFSVWRRHQQFVAKRCHYKARGSPFPEVEL